MPDALQVAVYGIAKNEEQHVKAWATSAQEADVRFVLDTGSTDGTVDELRRCGVACEQAVIDPWRFDNARNLSLSFLPEDVDYCVALDLDEQLQPGWRAALEDAHARGLTRPRYRYTWSWNADGAPGLVYGGDKVHTRHDYRWKHPVHEVLQPTMWEETQGWVDMEIHHHPDDRKSRGSYLPLLQCAVQEDPDDDRNAFYLARALLFDGQAAAAAIEFKRHLALPRATWRAERSASMRYLAACPGEEQETWLLRAAAEAPEHREPWVALAHLYYGWGSWSASLAAATRALAICERPLEYLSEGESWGTVPHDYAAIACFQLGLFEEAVKHGQTALELSPDDTRLRTNLEFYIGATR